MKVDLFDYDKFVKVNELAAVTNPIYLNLDNTPTEDGIFSYSIFGIPGSRQRSELPAYIDLNTTIINPKVYKDLVRLNSKLPKLIKGEQDFYITPGGQLEEVTSSTKNIENLETGTGMSWLQANFKKLKFRKSDSYERNIRINTINSLSMEEIFISKCLVLPAGYRDLNFADISSGRITIDEVNNFYIKLLNLSSGMQKNAAFSFLSNLTIFKIQTTMVEYIDFLLSKVSGKNGLLKKYLIGKNLDYTARVVITPPKYEIDSYKDMEVGVSEFGVPLHLAAVMYTPLVIKGVQELVVDKLRGKKRMHIGKAESPVETIELISEQLSAKQIEKLIGFFASSQESRFDPIYLEDKEGNVIHLNLFERVLNRPFTLTDMFFIVCSKIVKDKYVQVTRFPMDSYHNTNILKPKLITTEKTVTMDFNLKDDDEDLKGKETFLGKIERYPDINSKEVWRDQGVLDPTMTGVYGADHDGDMVSIVPLFTNEANDEGKRLRESKVSLLSVDGTPTRKVSNEAILVSYMMTKD